MRRRPPKRKRLSPQEKKDLSLRKDQRGDWYGMLSARKGIRSKSRALGHRRARRINKPELLRDPEASEARLKLNQRKRWRKFPGHSLAASVARKKQRRVDSHGRKNLARERGAHTRMPE